LPPRKPKGELHRVLDIALKALLSAFVIKPFNTIAVCYAQNGKWNGIYMHAKL
jgi:hypothetical protein